ncbi:WecA-like glycosyltransferase [Gemmata obscuriglobus]|uniref:Undecaprenyl/decaprenyl-phosphate alpha-N-acetylglucosaminyl 1-phosphate transferase n=1 Tax=Gemmata obscuriglobus TaxID=114 RepID=A0A2Z3H961_9BACT|nr:MraY family glycosyltransferase [Gemmata obscuriglobus]AWM40087.1 undecaprenyl/decaprenyl-phosphate alpha-N-acetylglucosaminyl 1-phosphate transferase [Gemmata obscuriglobus]QEG26747.1 WecA-like glycosyltransferase [Gemmata obscuriglobus]VTS02531.1 undecaprenyl-phosphate n-acetylglucosaminyl 1-phosphate transferase : Glycosyl transferase, family 4, conserved region-containing protein OS=Planctomyces brasiliensis (strain ATCC 49424 / DSM 5305 / JCM 21570 / NBRC 103401 / IFAM 1448) GN=Plabr_420
MTTYSLGSVWWVPLAAGTGAGLVLTRLARNMADRNGLVDAPDGRRKVQPRPVPVIGGVAVLLAAVLALAVTLLVSHSFAAAVRDDLRWAAALLAAVVAITAVGFVDDRHNLRARHKLAGQVVATLVLVAGGGYLIERVALFGWVVEFGPLAGPVTVFWLLACVNALNLIDGMDGLLGTVAVTGLGTLAVIALMVGQVFAATVALALCGAVAGFLWFNLPPATVYMGDAGSMLVGLVIGALAIPSSLKGPATVSLICPVAILILPVLDTTAAVIRRKLTGRGLATADRGHLHHVLLRHGLTVRRVLGLVAVLGLIASVGALASTALKNDLYALVAAAGVAVTLLATRLFGYAEFHLIRKRVSLALWSALGWDAAPAGTGLAVRIQGTIDWDSVWAVLAEAAGSADLQSLSLDVNAPELHENYHARWERATCATPDTHWWRVESPLFAHGHLIGRVAATGGRDSSPIERIFQTLARIVEATERRATELTEPAPAHGAVALGAR